MIVICSGCGKKYKIDFEIIHTDVAKFKCRVCNHVNSVTKPLPEDIKSLGTKHQSKETPATEPPIPEQVIDKEDLGRGIRFGLRAKMIALFILVPVVLMVVANIFWLTRMRRLSNLITEESSQMVIKTGQETIADKSRTVAKQVKLYLETHPNLKKENFFQDSVFKDITIQKVGQTGYTCLVERPNPGEPISKLWVHPIQKLIGVGINNAMKKTLGKHYQRWYDISINAFKGKGQEATGYYTWYDKREKYMAMAPVTGTEFFIAGTTYLDEFTTPVKTLQKRADILTSTTFRDVIIILVLATLLISIITFTYANRLSGNIRYLANIADRISLGELTAEMTLKSNDEIGILTEAINRMQVSIGMAMKRLRKRR
jgi:HAMP domain-containing protein